MLKRIYQFRFSHISHEEQTTSHHCRKQIYEESSGSRDNSPFDIRETMYVGVSFLQLLQKLIPLVILPSILSGICNLTVDYGRKNNQNSQDYWTLIL